MGQIKSKFKKSTLNQCQEIFEKNQESQRSFAEESKSSIDKLYGECKTENDVLALESANYAESLNKELETIEWNSEGDDKNSFNCCRRFMHLLTRNDGCKKNVFD